MCRTHFSVTGRFRSNEKTPTDDSIFIPRNFSNDTSNAKMRLKKWKKDGSHDTWIITFGHNVLANSWKSATHRRHSTRKSNKTSSVSHITSQELRRPSILHYHFEHICPCLETKENATERPRMPTAKRFDDKKCVGNLFAEIIIIRHSLK